MIELPDYTEEELKDMSQNFKEGIYNFKTIGFQNKLSKNENMMTELILTFDGVSFEFNKWEFFMHNQIKDPGHVMHKATISRIKHYLESVGLEYTKYAFKESNVVGREGKAFVWLHKKKGEEEATRCIKHFIKKEDDVILPEQSDTIKSSVKVEQKDTQTFDEDIPF